MIDNLLEPIINDGNEPCWLVLPTYEIKPMGLFSCTKCGAATQFLDGKTTVCKHCDFNNTHFENITKTINPDIWKIPKWKDIPVEDLDMQNTFLDIIELMKKCLILPDEILYKILSLWIISTWKTEQWTSVGFWIFRGEINSGKTTALDIICNLGYRMIHSAGTTFPAMVRATHFHKAGLCIDEASDRLDVRTETGREMLNFVKPSYRKGSVYTVADREDQEKMLSYKNFGFKVFAGEKGFNPSILSRSFDVVMQEEIPEVPSLKYVQDELDNLQTKLLNYKYKTDNPPDLGKDFCLKGRSREIFESIIATGRHIGIDVTDIIEYAEKLKLEKEEELQGTFEYDILFAIKEISCFSVQSTITGEMDAPEDVLISDIASKVYSNYEEMDVKEKKKKNASIGYSIRDQLHLKKKRTNKGVVLLLNEKNNSRLSYFFKKYKVE